MGGGGDLMGGVYLGDFSSLGGEWAHICAPSPTTENSDQYSLSFTERT